MIAIVVLLAHCPILIPSQVCQLSEATHLEPLGVLFEGHKANGKWHTSHSLEKTSIKAIQGAQEYGVPLR